MKNKVALSISLLILISAVIVFRGGNESVAAEARCSQTDFHMHMQTQRIADIIKSVVGSDNLYGKPVVEVNAKTIISKMNSAGIEKALTISSAYIWSMGVIADPTQEYEEVKAENDWTAEQAAKYPKRLIPVFSVNPLKDYSIGEMDRCFDTLDMPAMKIHFSNSDIDLRNSVHLEKVKNVLAHAESKGIPVIIHFANRNPDFGPQDAQIFIDEILAEYTNLKVYIVHLGGDGGGYNDNTGDIFDTFINAYKQNSNLKKENLYFDLSGLIITSPLPERPNVTTDDQLKRMSRQIGLWGLDRILFGSDYYMYEPSEYLKTIKQKLPISIGDYNKIINKDPAVFLN